MYIATIFDLQTVRVSDPRLLREVGDLLIKGIDDNSLALRGGSFGSEDDPK